jgi:DNA-binding transcriptional ArsR family regulator
MLMKAVRWLRESNLEVKEDVTADRADTGADAILDVAAAGRRARFAAQVKRRAPYPHEVERLDRSWHELAGWGRPLMVAPFISEPLGAILTSVDWSWADEQGNFDLRAPGLLLRQRRTAKAPTPRRRSLPGGSGSFAIIRALVASGDAQDKEPGAMELAARAGVSQPRVSQVLRRLQDLELVERSRQGRWTPQREPLLDRFLAEYPGPGGSEEYCYSLDSLVEVAVRAGQLNSPHRPIVASADVGPDLIVAWRRPSLVILYAKSMIDPSTLGLIDAQGRHDANVIVRMPHDQSVFPVPALAAQVRGSNVPLADPVQQIWDLQDLGGADRIEAAGRLREWLLVRP